MSAPAPAAALVPSAVVDGKKLIVPRFGGLPANCVKCARPAERPWKKQFRWHPSWMYIMIIFPGLLIYAIVAMIVQKKMDINLPMCEVHHTERKRNLWIGGILTLGALPGGLLLGNLGTTETGWLVGFLSFLAGLVFLVIAGRSLRPVLIDETHGEFTGACQAFLDLLPKKGQ
jgi:hypothetical protein